MSFCVTMSPCDEASTLPLDAQRGHLLRLPHRDRPLGALLVVEKRLLVHDLLDGTLTGVLAGVDVGPGGHDARVPALEAPDPGRYQQDRHDCDGQAHPAGGGASPQREEQHDRRGHVHEGSGQDRVLPPDPRHQHETGEEGAEDRSDRVGRVERAQALAGLAAVHIGADDQREGSAHEHGGEEHGHPRQEDSIEFDPRPRSVEMRERVDEELGKGLQERDGEEREEGDAHLDEGEQRLRASVSVGETGEDEAAHRQPEEERGQHGGEGVVRGAEDHGQRLGPGDLVGERGEAAGGIHDQHRAAESRRRRCLLALLAVLGGARPGVRRGRRRGR